MILLILIWLFLTLVFISAGVAVLVQVGKADSPAKTRWSIPDAFFTGFLSISVVAGYLSLFIALGTTVFIVSMFTAAVLLYFNFGIIKNKLFEFFSEIRSLSWTGGLILLILFFFICAYAASQITWGDTESYHAQAIQWIRKYAVVPGLGNIHGRFAFNSMFFVLSGIFSFSYGNILIFPVNGISFIFLIVKLLILISHEIKSGAKWKAVLFGLMGIFSFLLILPSLNSPSADAICAILIIYLITAIIEKAEDPARYGYTFLFLMTIIVMSCISFKMSSVFVVLVLFFVIKGDILRKLIVIGLAGIIIISPFLIRNYFLSGYLVYPFPDLDIFNVDWKIPYQNVLSMKQEIEGFAKIPSLPYTEVVNMRLSEWIPQWITTQSFNDLIILAGNSLSCIVIIIMLLKKDYFLVVLQLIIIANLLFWLNMAPDTRFAYGFLITGFALNLAYFVKIIEESVLKPLTRLTRVGLMLLLLIVLKTRIGQPLETIKSLHRWFEPAPFGSVETEVYRTNFDYRVPVQRGGCLNTEIPCVPFPFDNVIMRTSELRDGFRVDTTNYNYIHIID